MTYINKSINFEQDVFEEMENTRRNKFRSKFVNDAIREKLNIPRKGKKS